MGPDVRQLTSRLRLPLGQGLALTRDLSQSHKGKGVRVSLWVGGNPALRLSHTRMSGWGYLASENKQKDPEGRDPRYRHPKDET